MIRMEQYSEACDEGAYRTSRRRLIAVLRDVTQSESCPNRKFWQYQERTKRDFAGCNHDTGDSYGSNRDTSRAAGP